MPSYLEKYNGSRKNSEVKFVRSVKSFLNQQYQNKELIIVSDGCEKTNNLYDTYFKNEKEVTLIRCEKRKEVWPGTLREVGRSYASNEWICYLDTDDMFSGGHLESLSRTIDGLKNNETVVLCTQAFHPITLQASQEFKEYCGLGKDCSDQKWKKFYDEQVNYPTGLNGIMKIIGRSWQNNTKGIAGTWSILHKIDVKPRWKNRNQVGEDAEFIRALRKEEKVFQAPVGGYVIMHMSGYIDF
jgi:glycosyltransferase involved in cell wall biosynthesis